MVKKYSYVYLYIYIYLSIYIYNLYTYILHNLAIVNSSALNKGGQVSHVQQSSFGPQIPYIDMHKPWSEITQRNHFGQVRCF
jgi:hypothetical protein